MKIVLLCLVALMGIYLTPNVYRARKSGIIKQREHRMVSKVTSPRQFKITYYSRIVCLIFVLVMAVCILMAPSI